jgi:hypothetical protein
MVFKEQVVLAVGSNGIDSRDLTVLASKQYISIAIVLKSTQYVFVYIA